ncbi:MAG TPA: carboxypeptidase regulatory-like domain-containing protein [Terriglobales bacterium]|nr:carboxypeptidase regulatory-like domain-containing protein [Terriglobales bacterium]
MRSTIGAVLFLLLANFAFAQAKPQQAPAYSVAKPKTSNEQSAESSRLPVKRVVLYKNGVGYFEHSARVHGDQELGIDFTTAQLNDVLKSLTVVDLGDGRISGVRYNSIAPLGERLKALRLPFGEQVSRTGFLTALRGARVEVRSKAETALGRLLSVEQQERTTDSGTTYQATLFSVLTDIGEMKNFELGPTVSVRLAERDLNDEVGRYLNLVGSSRARDLRRMTISATGSGDRDIFVSYISEVPVWKSTYRIILPEKASDKPLLQGWAIVDNTIGEDWRDVQLSLIAGAPQSFIQDISLPLYARRPVVPLPESAMLTPQTHEATEYDRLEQYSKLQAPPPVSAGVVGGVPGGVAGGSATGIGGGVFRIGGPSGTLEGTVTDSSGAGVGGATVTARNQQGLPQSGSTDSSGHYQLSVPSGTYDVTVEARGFSAYSAKTYVGVSRSTELNATLQVGSTNETVTVSAESAEISPEAQGGQVGDYFEYNLKQKITINKNQSALVPILQSRVEAEKVTLWTSKDDDDTDNGHVPLRAIWIKNTSGQMLDSGTFNILDGGAFAGEGVLQSIHPDERRLLSYAADTAVHVKQEDEAINQPYSRVKIAKGVMLLTQEERDKSKFHIRNADKVARVVVLEIPAQDGWSLTKDTPKPEESTASFHRFRVPVGGGKTAELTVQSVHPQDTQYALTNLDSNLVAILGRQQRITPAMQDAFDRVITARAKVSGFDQQMIQRRQETDQISADQNRIRENMKALKGSAEEKALLQRYTGELNKQEDRLAAIRTELADLQQKRNEAAAELDRTVMAVNIDESF